MAPLRLPPIPKSLLNTPDPSTGSKPTSASNEMNTLRMDEGDIQVAVSVWETLKKEGKGGSVGYTHVWCQNNGTQLSHFEGNASTAAFSIPRGNHPCHTCTPHNHLPRRRSISFGPITCGDLCRTLGVWCRFSDKHP